MKDCLYIYIWSIKLRIHRTKAPKRELSSATISTCQTQSGCDTSFEGLNHSCISRQIFQSACGLQRKREGHIALIGALVSRNAEAPRDRACGLGACGVQRASHWTCRSSSTVETSAAYSAVSCSWGRARICPRWTEGAIFSCTCANFAGKGSSRTGNCYGWLLLCVDTYTTTTTTAPETSRTQNADSARASAGSKVIAWGTVCVCVICRGGCGCGCGCGGGLFGCCCCCCCCGWCGC